MKVSVVTDSTSDLPPEVARELGITVVPAQMQFGEQVFLDGVELGADEFYRRLQSSPMLPKTSPASIATFNSSTAASLKKQTASYRSMLWAS